MKRSAIGLFMLLLGLAPYFVVGQDKAVYQVDSVETSNLERFSNMIIDSVNNGYPQIVIDHLSMENFFAELWSQLDSTSIAHIPSTDIENIKMYFEKDLKKSIFPFPDDVVDNIGWIGNYWSESDRPHLIYRYVSGGSFGYFDLELLRNGDTFSVADVFVFSTSSYLSTVMKSILESTVQYGSSDPRVNVQIGFTNAVKNESYAEATNLYNQLTEKEQDYGFNCIQHVKALALQNRNKEALDAAKFFIKKDSSNIATYMLLLSIYDSLKEYSKCLETVNSIDKLIGGDIFLNYQRAVLNRKMNNAVRFVAFAKQVMQDMPTYQKMHHQLINEALELKDAGAMMDILEAYSSNFYVTPEVMGNIKANASFMKDNPRYIEWIKEKTLEYENWVNPQ
ncbi:tetratricopeptide repeat protein [Alistipes sp. ZOR0009]|uniref:tetratricopeptide repeat protein n=1 Tax=Alistipes sp. ZOR0009 TaxID=1339253 RepID=UPI000647F90D|nr:hypothetical protein [Alistipes sp. ZOR0009]